MVWYYSLKLLTNHCPVFCHLQFVSQLTEGRWRLARFYKAVDISLIILLLVLQMVFCMRPCQLAVLCLCALFGMPTKI